MLNNIDQAEAKEVQRDVHEVGRAVRHQTQNLISHDLGIHGLCDVLLNHSLVVGFLHVQMLSFFDEVVRQVRGHQQFVLEQHVEQLLSQNREILLLKQLRVDLTELIKLGIDLIFRN